jgi:hypothetical protein
MKASAPAKLTAIRPSRSDISANRNEFLMTLNRRSTMSAMLFGLGLGLFLLASAGSCLAQALPPVRGMYTPGFNATNSGVMPEPGFTYGQSFMDYSFDQFRSASGAIVAQNNAAVFMDINAFEWVAKKKILGANYALAALLPFSNSSISSPTLGAIAGGGGFSDSFYQPLTLGWHFKRADIQVAYGFFAPTGRFTAGATNNTGTGHWTNSPTAGETFYLTKNKRTSVSAYQLYEFHTTQQGTNIHPGQTFNLDYSLMQILPVQKEMHTLLQFGLVGYGQWQTSNNSGPGVNLALPAHYSVNAIGGAGEVILPARKVSVGFKLFKEFSNSSTVQGYSLQIVGGITF